MITDQEHVNEYHIHFLPLNPAHWTFFKVESIGDVVLLTTNVEKQHFKVILVKSGEWTFSWSMTSSMDSLSHLLACHLVSSVVRLWSSTFDWLTVSSGLIIRHAGVEFSCMWFCLGVCSVEFSWNFQIPAYWRDSQISNDMWVRFSSEGGTLCMPWQQGSVCASGQSQPTKQKVCQPPSKCRWREQGLVPYYIYILFMYTLRRLNIWKLDERAVFDFCSIHSPVGTVEPANAI